MQFNFSDQFILRNVNSSSASFSASQNEWCANISISNDDDFWEGGYEPFINAFKEFSDDGTKQKFMLLLLAVTRRGKQHDVDDEADNRWERSALSRKNQITRLLLTRVTFQLIIDHGPMLAGCGSSTWKAVINMSITVHHSVQISPRLRNWQLIGNSAP